MEFSKDYVKKVLKLTKMPSVDEFIKEYKVFPDNFNCENCSNCYECINCKYCNNCYQCENCHSCDYLFNSNGCYTCHYSTDLNNQVNEIYRNTLEKSYAYRIASVINHYKVN